MRSFKVADMYIVINTNLTYVPLDLTLSKYETIKLFACTKKCKTYLVKVAKYVRRKELLVN